MNLIIYFIAGYAVGRIAHMHGGRSTPSIHHWIPGVLLIIIGWKSVPVMLFGLGLVVSDLNDFMNLRIYGIAKVEKYSFWGID
ncbi:MAG: hypothetical protein KKA10_10140 [Euryarchaeota archaeon]|nr:hypothetical protein [Euryarchaeota archaeon]MCG2736262.1 hypothetical protein [Candidatus Methanoperedenaceae archaeon]